MSQEKIGKFESARGRPKEEGLKQRRQDEILTEATKHFSEKGYAGTDVESIAESLGVGKGTIYRYFPSKRELMLSALHKGLTDLDQFVQARIATVNDDLEKIYAAIRAFLEYFDSHPELAELFLQERACLKDQAQPTFFAVSQANIEPWLDRHLRLVAANRIRGSLPIEWLSLVNEMLFGLILTNHLLKRRGQHAQQAEHFLRIVFEGLWTEQEHARQTLYPKADSKIESVAERNDRNA
ncbi:MAG: TetR/AcrR family transcriptional regulator [Pirellulales bacterium]